MTMPSRATQRAITRRGEVARLQGCGKKLTEIAESLGVTRMTIHRDYQALGLKCFEPIDDGDLDNLVRTAVEDEAGDTGMHVGYTLIESSIYKTTNIRIPEKKIRDAMVRLALHSPRICTNRRRLHWFESMGPDGVWCLDQNEKLNRYGFKIIAVIDAFSRFPVHWELVTDLTGATHSKVFSNAVAKMRGLPAHVSVDCAAAWNGVKAQVGHIYDLDVAVQRDIDGEV
mmetsp:Transcript_5356/g.6973  ORF Transcript_5356/g.6973 Transcript_5356/m.6973 type:complete len:228 (+) Transcript_5356:221-904(+)|eukprot:CAMPEP_0114358234 /NCGR_PEP_ID=MMETSP0101-20121206/22165_1 /TAXON_ID=38822 ORGANISM="Pteridomonas danica, Strain PT" /NCGR_SAMPLE_ID=MMETSP0101 /ASSEMBLY_ACC=CAM_ASM_000211 /LENGTH=227 /DNA_ID=CAMNT_0001501277 /DNA_START=205 /DNA_END=888 /DNA_ORIENTATION=-